MTANISNMIELNGERKTLAEQVTVRQLVTQENITGKRFLVVINDTLVPKSDWDNTTISAGDKVDIMTAITGG